MASVRVKVDIVFSSFRVRASLGMRICARTTARIRRHADKEHKEQDQKIRREKNLCMLVDCSACICVSECISTWVYGCLPACVATLQCSHIRLLVLRPNNPAMAMVTDFQSIHLVCFCFQSVFIFIHARNIEHKRRRSYRGIHNAPFFVCSSWVSTIFIAGGFDYSAQLDIRNAYKMHTMTAEETRQKKKGWDRCSIQ